MDSIVVNQVKKSFRVYFDKGASLKEKILFQNRNRYEQRTVLDGISFKVRKGEAVGLIGKNGCGKSTMLKLLTRIMYPDDGEIQIVGRVSSLIELGAGFHPDMSGRENIYTNAAIFGLTRPEIQQRLQQIIDFSELHDYIDNPIRTYSSGMYMRLAFSVAINVDAEVLLIDEILAVGDAAFQAKCFKKLKEIKENGTTIIIVSHSLGQIEEFCERSIWFNHGKVRMVGSPKEVHLCYLDYMNGGSGKIAVEETSDIGNNDSAPKSEPLSNDLPTENSALEMLSFLQKYSILSCSIEKTDSSWLGRHVKDPILQKVEISASQFLQQQSQFNSALVKLLDDLCLQDNSLHALIDAVEKSKEQLKVLHLEETNRSIEQFQELQMAKDYFGKKSAEYNYRIQLLEQKQNELCNQSLYYAETLEKINYRLSTTEEKQSELYNQSLYYAKKLEEFNFRLASIEQKQGKDCDELLIRKLEFKVEELITKSNYYDNILKEQNYRLVCDSLELKKFRTLMKRTEIQKHYESPNCNKNASSFAFLQLVGSLKVNDAIGNYALALKSLLSAHNIVNTIVYLEVDEVLKDEGIPFERMQYPSTNSVMLLHMSAETLFADLLDAYGCKKILFYHNITPPIFFNKNSLTYISTINGLKQTQDLCNKCSLCIVPSEYNQQCLRDMGYLGQINVVPLIIDTTLYNALPDEKYLTQFRDGKKNFLFVGRISPNKCQHDLIKIFKWYTKEVSSDCRLILAGKYDNEDDYYKFLMRDIPPNVILTGELTHSELKACYETANIFLCLSEHEGVCIPIVEAMYFSIPIIAYEKTAVPETLGSGGVLLKNKDPQAWGQAIKKAIDDKVFQQKIILEQQKQLKRFDSKTVQQQTLDIISPLLGGCDL